jgi:Domain of unknown function (DUF4288)
MNWYMSKLIFRIVCGDGNHAPQFDEQLRLINARDEKEAFHKAAQLGRREETSFLNDRQQTVSWQFINLSELYKLSSLEDGAEIYSKIEEREQAGSFIDVINKRAAWLKTKLRLDIFSDASKLVNQ